MRTYYENNTKNYTPIVKATLHDPLSEKSIETEMIIDTGFQGGVLLPLSTYVDLNLNIFEEPKVVSRTAVGNIIELRKSKVIVELNNTKIACTAYTTLGVMRSLLGREVLKELGLLYNPPKELKLGIHKNK